MEVHVQSFGARLRAKGGIFEIIIPDLTGGGADQREEFAPHQVSTILIYDNKGSVSASALMLAMQSGVDVLLCDEHGHPAGRLWPNTPHAPLSIQKAQLLLIGTPQSLEFVKHWLSQKFRRKIAFLKRLQRYREGEKVTLLQTTAKQLTEYQTLLQQLPPKSFSETIQTIRGYEGTASRIYFDTLSKLLQPEYRFNGRSRQPARDIFNAFLNYGYDILYREVEKTLIHAGIHPYIGFLHTTERKGKAMLYDFIEPFRPWVDNLVFVLCSRKHATRKHLVEHNNGWWLSKDGRELILEAFHNVFQEKRIHYKGRQISQLQVISADARSLARQMQKVWKTQGELSLQFSSS